MLENMHTNSIKIGFISKDGIHIFDDGLVVQIPNDKALDVMHSVFLHVI